MLEHLPENFFSEDLIQAHIQSKIGTEEFRRWLVEMMEALRRTNPVLAASISGAVSTASSPDTKIGFLSGAFYILSLLDQKISSEDLDRLLEK